MNPLRKQIVNKFYELGTIKWSPCRNIANTKNTLYQENTVYYGMPFSRRNWIDYKVFCQKLKNSIYEFSTGLKYIQGVNCAGSVLSCFSPKITFPFMWETYDLLVNRKYVIPLGRILIKPKLIFSNGFIRDCNKEIFYEAYTRLQIGDIVCRYFRKTPRGGWYSHTLLITGDTHIEYDNHNQIDENLSYIIISENNYYFNKMQYTEENNKIGLPFKANQFLTDITSLEDLNGKFSNFTFNKKISFLSLFQDQYIPLTFNCYYH